MQSQGGGIGIRIGLLERGKAIALLSNATASEAMRSAYALQSGKSQGKDGSFACDENQGARF